jgi:uncharacterized protein YbcI
MELETDVATPRGQTIAAITNSIVRLHARMYGKGPSRASTHLRDGSYVLCMLRDPFTVAEHTLIDCGRLGNVYENRRAFYEAEEAELRSEVERLTGHPVVAFVPGISIENDLVTQLFVLDEGEPAA